jgi:3-oxoacyl-[acyl-carrier-protein] synthase-1
VTHRSAVWGDPSQPTLVVAETGAVNGLGFTSRQTWAFWRAEAVGHTETPFRCANGSRAVMVTARALPPRSTGAARMAALLDDAFAQLTPARRALGPAARTAVVLCLGERYHAPIAPRLARERAALEARVGQWAGDGAPVEHAATVAEGNASLAEALMVASALLDEGRCEAVAVGGVDTQYDADSVEGLLIAERLFDGRNVDSMTPGEGAAFLLVTRPATAHRAGLAPRAVIEAASVDAEPGAMFADEPCTGAALARVMRAAAGCAGRRGRPVGWIVGDLTNESYRAFELQLALPRAFAGGGLDDGGAGHLVLAAESLRRDFLPFRFGDLGAATMVTAAVIASEAFVRGDPRPRGCLVFGSSVTPPRGAVLLSAALSAG